LNGHVLYAVGRQKSVTVAMAVVTVAKLLVNALAISRWSAWGAVVVALSFEGMLYAWLQWLVWRSVMRAPKTREEEVATGGRKALAATDVSQGNLGEDGG
jgi:O-antigen/teichoic acid export membrane protein